MQRGGMTQLRFLYNRKKKKNDGLNPFGCSTRLKEQTMLAQASQNAPAETFR